MFWVFDNPERFLEERAALQSLAGEVNWIKFLHWDFCNGTQLKVDIDLVIGDRVFDIELVYPDLFPDTAAYVCPRTLGGNWSSHQYASGVLCLEWGPDNWHSGITGAELVRNTYKLLATEAGRDGSTTVVPSRHKLTLGQEIRNTIRRLVITPKIMEFLNSLLPQSQHKIEALTIYHDTAQVSFISKIFKTEKDIFKPTDFPSEISDCFSIFSPHVEGWIFKSNNFDHSKAISNIDALVMAIREAGFADFAIPEDQADASANTKWFFVLMGEDRKCRAFLIDTCDKTTVKAFTIIEGGNLQEQRLPAEHQSLSDKRIGIVGLGSVGGKVAVSLARSGIRKFLLVDDDIMLPENVCRHELNWISVGVNKAAAIKETLCLISPDMDVKVEESRITGQESAKYASIVLDALAECDLIVDATANTSVFVQLAAIAKRKNKPLIWGELFAGAIGGLLARSRPNKDLDPLKIRMGIINYLKTLPEAPFVKATGYDVDQDDSVPLLATDAEVTQFAATVTRFALDSLLDKVPSEFPYSAYLIGYKRAWIFEAPFDTRPINIEFENEGKAELSDNELEKRQQAANILLEILKEHTNAHSDSAG